MEKKKFYRKNLPHLQIQEQTFFVTWLLAGVHSNREFSELKIEFERIRYQIKEKSNNKKKDLKEASNKYFLEFDKKLNTLKSGKHFMKKPEVAQVVADSIHYWDNKRIDLYCYCIMSNHVHAVFTVFKKNELGSPLYLQDIMQSIKNYSARGCNKLLGLKGQFGTTKAMIDLLEIVRNYTEQSAMFLTIPSKQDYVKKEKIGDGRISILNTTNLCYCKTKLRFVCNT